MAWSDLTASPPGGLYTYLVFVGTSAALNFNNLKILGEGVGARNSAVRPEQVFRGDLDPE